MDLRRNVFNLTRLIEPGRALKVTLRRDGETKDFSIIPDKLPPNVVLERRQTEVRGMLVPTRAPMAAMSGDSTERRAVEKAFAAGGRGFAITRASNVPMAQLMVTNGLPGARMTDLDSAAVFSLTREKAWHGVLVTEVLLGSVAARMGLRSGDMIVALDDIDVTSLPQLHRELMTRSSNKPKQLVVIRAGKIEKLSFDPR
jgi:S1-C subfamily serine protease